VLLLIVFPVGVAFSRTKSSTLLVGGELIAQGKTREERLKVAIELNKQGLQLSGQGKKKEALELFEKALVICREIGDKSGEGKLLNNIGAVYNNLGQYQKALDFYQQSLAISQKIGDKAGEGIIFARIGDIYNNLQEVKLALDYYQQALAINQQTNNKVDSVVILNKIGEVYLRIGQYKKALELISKAHEEINSRGIDRDVTTLGEYLQSPTIFPSIVKKNIATNLGEVYSNLGDFEKAKLLLQKALVIAQAENNRLGEATILDNFGSLYINMAEKESALEYYQKSLKIYQEIKDKSGEANTLMSIGSIDLNLGYYQKAQERYNQALAIFQQNDNKIGQGKTLINLGELNRQLSQYPNALKFLNQALKILTSNKNSLGVAATLNNIGLVYQQLGQQTQALNYFQRALEIRKKIDDLNGLGTTLHNIGLVYDELGKQESALKFYQQALAIRQEIGDQVGEATTLNNIALINSNNGNNQQALNYLKQALSIFQKFGYGTSISNTLDSLGTVYKNNKQYDKALESYQQGLIISKKVGSRFLERVILSHIGDLFAQKKPELAIIFYKQSINIIETTRKDLKALPKEQQQSYITTVADTYRRLADLLLKQDRILEAQQVLDLLKVREIEDYFRSKRGTGQQLVVLRPEEEILKKYDEQQKTAIKLGQELTQLQKIASERQLTPDELQQRNKLVRIQEDFNKQFNQFSELPEIVQLLNQLSRSERKQILDLADLDGLRDDLRLNSAVLFYPLILDDRLELIITTPDSPPLHRTVNVKREDLNRVILQFRQALQNPSLDAKTPARQLYEWLIKPLEKDLKQVNLKTIIYSPDGQLRYIPLSALYDGKQWLAERYRINNITSKSLTNFNVKPQLDKRILAGAFTKGNYNIKVGEVSFPFRGLAFASIEIENLVKLLPNTTKLIDKEFSLLSTTTRMNEYNIVHFATHAAFVPGDATQSFILFGDGSIATLKDIGNWTLNNVDLIVLSACETGLGGKLGNGEEVLGLGYQFQNRGVRATIASLWQVDDGGTQVLINAFYQAWNKNNITKAEALQQAQIALITGNFSDINSQQRGIDVTILPSNLKKTSSSFQHPYYWAPFILIGNGL
jgi:CHAT domain-containing protein/Tfp pilus assembly protein PilF